MINTIRKIIYVLGAVLFISKILFAQDLRRSEPADLGLSAERLKHLDRVIQEHIDQELLAGCVALVARDGNIAYLNAAGMQDREANVPMKQNTIFRIASMSKPITSVAVMMLYEEGRFRLSDPISKYIPAFENARVLANADGGSGSSSGMTTVPARQPITIRHLLTHTSGLGYQWTDELGELYYENDITHGLVEDENTLAEDIPELAKMPLLFHPGEQYNYSLSVDVLGYLVEVVSGMSLDRFLDERIFTPLGMDDTFFHVPKDKQSRLSAAYTVGDDGGLKRLRDEPVLEGGTTLYSATYPSEPKHRFLSGGAGLCSTVPDYFRFTSMLLNDGELDGVRLLSPKTVELMTTDHVGDLLENNGFGLGFGVTRSLAESGELDSVGKYYWGSFWYGTFFIDPTEDLIGICIAQKHPGGDATLNSLFGALVYQALVE